MKHEESKSKRTRMENEIENENEDKCGKDGLGMCETRKGRTRLKWIARFWNGEEV